MSPEKIGGVYPIWKKIEDEAASVAPNSDFKELKDSSPESKAEELFALWRDYRRLVIPEQTKFAQTESAKREKDPSYKSQRFENNFGTFSDPALVQKAKLLKQAIAERWHDPKTQEAFKINLEKSLSEQKETAVGRLEYEEMERAFANDTVAREEIYQEVFKHRDKDPDELTQISIAELSAKIKDERKNLSELELSSPELAARLSFERLKGYREQMAKDGFIWTPSREEYFKKIIDHLVVVNQNRPLMLTGETGTGKTRLARAVSRRLTGKNPYEVGEEAKSDIRPLLGSRGMENGETFVNYGQLGQAISGKTSSRDKNISEGGIFYMDEMNGYPADALRSLVKQVSGRRSGEEITFSAWFGNKEKLSPKFGFLGSANLPSEKHPDRVDLPVEVAREMGALEIDYPTQDEKNPELYEMMLAALMDQNGRIRLSKEELEPHYNDVVNSATNEKEEVLDADTKQGGALWRFANLVANIQKSYKGEENALTDTKADASYLRQAVLDPGLVLSWLQAYRKSASRQQINLQTFLADKLEAWSDQKLYPEEDRNLIKSFLSEFKIEKDETKFKATILSPLEIGALSPRVPRRAQLLTEAPKPLESSTYLPDGTELFYNPDSKELASGSRFKKKGGRSDYVYIFKGEGLHEHAGEAVLEIEGGEVMFVEMSRLKKEWEPLALTYSEKVNGKEIKIDVLETRQKSEAFYKGHNLSEFVAGLPKDIKFSKAGEARIHEALKMGFDSAMIMPASAIQQKNVESLATELAKKEYSGLSAADQYTEPYFEDKTKESEPLNRPAKAYLILYQSGEVPPETKGKSPDVLRPLFKQKKWDGFTLPEYLIIQRKELEERKNHSFDAYDTNSSKSQWTWLLDTKVPPAKVVHARWDPGNRRVRVRWSGSDYSNEDLGARPVVVIEIL